MKNNDDTNQIGEIAYYHQIDITDHYKESYYKILEEENISFTSILKEKVYPNGVTRITYSPQTESIYYYRSSDTDNLLGEKKWDVFEDRGAKFESRLISNLSEIQEIKEDYEKIIEEEIEIEKLRNDQLLESISEFVKINGLRGYRYHQATKENEKCRFYEFKRANIIEEIILFTNDKTLILSRTLDNDIIIQKPIKTVNRTVICWYYEGLLRQKRLEQKQKFYRKKT